MQDGLSEGASVLIMLEGLRLNACGELPFLDISADNGALPLKQARAILALVEHNLVSDDCRLNDDALSHAVGAAGMLLAFAQVSKQSAGVNQPH